MMAGARLRRRELALICSDRKMPDRKIRDAIFPSGIFLFGDS
jgi:hypothetical protein